MDLRLLNAEPTEAERDAIDAFLGPSLQVWATDGNGHAAHGGHATRSQRQMLLPTLHALHERAGWTSPGGLNYVARRLTVPPADVYGVATFYALFSVTERPPRVVHVCDDIACRCAGSEELIAQLGPEGADLGGATWLRSPCLGQCDRAPDALLTGRRRAGGARAHGDRRRRGAGEPGRRDAAATAVDHPAPGRPAGPAPARSHRRRQPRRPHYLICNADESEPSTFKDRVLMEGDPFALIESMTIAAYATGCELGYVYLRGEYRLAQARLENAIEQARERGFLGQNVLGHGVAFDVEVR